MPEKTIPPDIYASVFPMICEKCGAVAATPYQATTIKQQEHTIDVGMRCRECGHEWALQLQSSR